MAKYDNVNYFPYGQVPENTDTRGVFGTGAIDPRHKVINPIDLIAAKLSTVEAKFANTLYPMFLESFSKMSKQRVNFPELSWKIIKPTKCVIKFNEAIDFPIGTSKELTTNNPQWLKPGSLIGIIDGGELHYISAVNGNRVTVSRGWAVKEGYSPISLAAGEELSVHSSTYEEGSLRPLSVSGLAWKERMGMAAHNEFQIIRNSYGQTGSALASNASDLLINSDSTWADIRAAALNQQLTEQEMAYMFGIKSRHWTNGQKHTTMDGVYVQVEKYAPENVIKMPQTVSLSSLEKILMGLNQYDVNNTKPTNEKIIICSEAQYLVWQKIARAMNSSANVTVQVNDTNKIAGVAHFEKIRIGGMLVTPMIHGLFKYHPKLSNKSFIWDPRAIDLFFLGCDVGGDRDLVNEESVEILHAQKTTWDAIGMDAKMGSFISETSVRVNNPYALAIIDNMCDVGCEVCIPAPAVHYACLSIDKPCNTMNAYPVGEVVKVTASGPVGLKGNLILPNGSKVPFTIGADGKYVHTYTITSAPAIQRFFWESDTTEANSVLHKQTSYSNLSVATCVRQGCEVTKIVVPNLCSPTATQAPA